MKSGRLTDKVESTYALLDLEFRQAIDTLNESQRKAVILCCVLGYNQEEAAEQLGINQSTVQRHVKGALKTLKVFLEGSA